MKNKVILVITCACIFQFGSAQSVKLLGKQMKLLGTWELVNIYFGRDVDINKDGVKSKNALKEKKCCKIERMDFNGQYESKSFCVTTNSECEGKHDDINFTWEMVEKEIDVRKKVDGENITVKELKLIINLVDKEGLESREWIVDEISKKTLVVYDYRPDGSDTTAPCKLTWEKK